MRRVGGFAAAAGVCLSMAMVMAADATPKPPVSVSMTLSRAHGVLTVVIKNEAAVPICVDPNYAASARLAAWSREGKPLRNPMAVEGQARINCMPLGPHKAMHLVYEVGRLYPFGLPGDSRLCYGSWWMPGGPTTRAPAQKVGRCVAVPPEGLGRR